MFSRLINKFKKDVADLRNGTPGKRFIEHYERHRRSEDPQKTKWKTAAFVAGGIVLIVVGVLLDTIAQVEQHRTLRKYDGFMKTGRVKFRGRQQRFM